jgi:hypothetical protein
LPSFELVQLEVQLELPNAVVLGYSRRHSLGKSKKMTIFPHTFHNWSMINAANLSATMAAPKYIPIAIDHSISSEACISLVFKIIAVASNA